MARDMTDFIASELAKAEATVTAMRTATALHAAIEAAATMCCEALDSGAKILMAGNGGSAADAQHWVGELVSRFHYDRPGLPAIALTTDTSILTSVGNDYGFDYAFARQIEALGRAGDVFLGITTSGRSPNILRAMKAARAKGIRTIGVTGTTGGDLPGLCDLCLQIPSDETPHIQEGHEIVGHILCGLIERHMFPLDRSRPW